MGVKNNNPLEKLEIKCSTSNFKKSFVNTTFRETNHKNKRNRRIRLIEKDRISWVRSFKQLIKFEKNNSVETPGY